MRTLSKRWPKGAPRGDYPADCHICGIPYRRSQMLKNPDDGTLACSGPGTLNCAKERRAATLDRMNAEAAVRAPIPPFGGAKDGSHNDDVI